MTKWHKITVKYQYADGSPAEVVKEVYGKKAIQKEIKFISEWLINHNRTVVETTVTEVN